MFKCPTFTVMIQVSETATIPVVMASVVTSSFSPQNRKHRKFPVSEWRIIKIEMCAKPKRVFDVKSNQAFDKDDLHIA